MNVAILASFFCLSSVAYAAEALDRPNFVIVFADDLGYGDLGCYGQKVIRTPRLDEMARRGVRFTSFYAQTVCGPSRAALMTGCYPIRVAKKIDPTAIHPFLHTREITLAEVLKTRGYATGCFGKWDLAGHRQRGYEPDLLPTRQGFDYFFGTPTSNDAVVNLLRNERVIQPKADMNTLTRRYTDEAIAFIEKHRDEPFFVYLPHTMPHTILGASDEFRGRSKRGLYGDVVEEIDHNTGRIVDAIRRMKLDSRTYVFFISDNGPWHVKGPHGGSAGPLRGAKTSTWEGGLRVPCVAWAPGRVPGGAVCDGVASTLDMLPTLAALAGAAAPADRTIDGHDIRGLLHGVPGATSPTRAFYYYQHTHLQAVRSGRWKLHLPHAAQPPFGPRWAHHIAKADAIDVPRPMLFDLDADVGETTDVAEDHPDVVARLLEWAERARADLGDHNRLGSGVRSF